MSDLVVVVETIMIEQNQRVSRVVSVANHIPLKPSVRVMLRSQVAVGEPCGCGQRPSRRPPNELCIYTLQIPVEAGAPEAPQWSDVQIECDIRLDKAAGTREAFVHDAKRKRRQQRDLGD